MHRNCPAGKVFAPVQAKVFLLSVYVKYFWAILFLHLCDLPSAILQQKVRYKMCSQNNPHGSMNQLPVIHWLCFTGVDRFIISPIIIKIPSALRRI
jgi:hypothetical protein